MIRQRLVARLDKDIKLLFEKYRSLDKRLIKIENGSNETQDSKDDSVTNITNATGGKLVVGEAKKEHPERQSVSASEDSSEGRDEEASSDRPEGTS